VNDRTTIGSRDGRMLQRPGHQRRLTGLEPANLRMHAIAKPPETAKSVFLAVPMRFLVENDEPNFVNFSEDPDGSKGLVAIAVFGRSAGMTQARWKASLRCAATATVWLGLSSGLVGCKATPRPEVATGSPELSTITVGESCEHRPIVVHVLDGAAMSDTADVVLIMASIHGDETAGTPLANRLLAHLQANPAIVTGRRVIVMPVANPDGVAARRRTNVHGVDLNRNFATANRKAGRRAGAAGLSEPETQAIDRVLAMHRPVRIVSMHQPLACIDYDGPGEALARRMSLACGLPVKKVGALPGSLGSYAGETLGVPIITFELPRSADRMNEEELWQRYGGALLEAVRGSQ
jgi:murein peptide amidase A